MNIALNEIGFPLRLLPGRPLTDEELYRFCAENELLRVERDVNGELILMSPTGLEGDARNTEITTDLTLWARQDGRGRSFGSNAGFTLPDGSMRSPDGAWMSWERWNALPGNERQRFGHVCPEFILELRSESDRISDVRDKIRAWIENGVELAWLIDPQRKVVEVFRPGQQPELHDDPSSVQGTGCVAGFELVMERVWG